MTPKKQIVSAANIRRIFGAATATPKRTVGSIAAVGGVVSLAGFHLKFLSPEQIGVAAAILAGGITVWKALVIEEKTVVIEKLVDGRYGDVLSRLAEMSAKLADRTGLPADRQAADAARAQSDAQVARVTAVEAKK